MGMIRKMTSVSTMGMVGFTSPREKQANAARRSSRAEARVLREQARLLRAQREALEQQS